LREGDALAAVLPGTTRDRLVLFSTRGTLYVLRVADVPATTGSGEPGQSLLKFGDGERVVPAPPLREEGGAGAGPPPPAPAETAAPSRSRSRRAPSRSRPKAPGAAST